MGETDEAEKGDPFATREFVYARRRDTEGEV